MFELYFSSCDSIHLVKTVFKVQEGQVPLVCTRGKEAFRSSFHGSFQWTSVVKSVCELFLRAHLHRLSFKSEGDVPQISGSQVNKLYQVLRKRPGWMKEMFGLQPNKRLVLESILDLLPASQICRISPGWYSGIERIAVYLDSQLVENPAEIGRILTAISSSSAGSRLKDERRRQAARKEVAAGPTVSASPATSASDFEWFRSILKQEIISMLRCTDIFGMRSLERYVSRIHTHPIISRLIGSQSKLPGIIKEVHKDSAFHFGLIASRPDLVDIIRNGPPIRVEATLAQVGSIAIFIYLKEVLGCPIEVNFQSIHGVELANRIIHNSFLRTPDLIIQGLSPAAMLVRQAGPIGFSCMMLMPKSSYRIIYPSANRPGLSGNERVGGVSKGDMYLLLDDYSQSSVVVEEAAMEGFIERSKFSLHHIGPDDVIAEFASFPRNSFMVSWFPNYYLNNRVHNAQVFGHDSHLFGTKDTILFSHKERFSGNRGIAMEFLIRHAWLELKTDTRRIEHIVDVLLEDRAFLTYFLRVSGVHKIEKFDLFGHD